MPFTLTQFAERRPFLYHLTSAANLAHILDTRRILSAWQIFSLAGKHSLRRVRRNTHEHIRIGGQVVHVRDQSPLHLGNMALEPGWALDDFVAYLNKRAFFWPGTEAGPSAYGVRHYNRYAAERPVILRLPTSATFAKNQQPQFCRFNSGSPRCSYGKKSPRTADTFVAASDAPYSVPDVVEVTFLRWVALPDQLHIARSPDGPWRIRS